MYKEIESPVKRYKEDTTTFSLLITYTEKKVTFTLRDYIEWVIYEKTYSK
jgi:hypothetical protein